MIVWAVAGPVAAALLLCAIAVEVRDARRGVPTVVPTMCAIGMMLVAWTAAGVSIGLAL